MKRILLASAAVIALAIAAPLAGAQYTDPTTSPLYETQATSPTVDDPMNPQTHQSPPPVTAPQPSATAPTTTYSTPSTMTPATADPYAQPAQAGAWTDPSVQTGVTADTGATTTTQAQVDPYGQPVTTQTDPQVGASTTVQAQTDSYGQPVTTPDAGMAPSTVEAQSDPYAAPATTESYDSYGATSTQADAGAYGSQNVAVDMMETARLAGMDSVPMTPAEVCAPRSVTLAQSSRLNTQARRHLIVAADHASVCEVQRVVVHSPDGRATAVRQTLVDHGFDSSRVEVERGDELGVEMTFAGVATSSPEYAAIFNPVQSASYAPGAQPYAQPSTEADAMSQTSAYPQTGVQSTTAPVAQPISYQQPAAPAYQPPATQAPTYDPPTYMPPPLPDEPVSTEPVDEDPLY